MAYHEGRVSSVGVNSLDIVGITDASLTLTASELETSVHGSSSFRTYITGRRDGVLTMSILFDDSQNGQQELINSWDPADVTAEALTYVITLSSDASGTNDAYTASGIITDLSFSTPNDDIATMDVTVRLTGSITIA